MTGQRQSCAQHRGGVSLPAGTGSDGVADVAANLEQPWREAMPDDQPPVVLITACPPQRRLGNMPCWSGRVIESLGTDGCDETCEAVRARPVLPDLPELLVGERALVSALSAELRHRFHERSPHVGGWWGQLRFFCQHSSIVVSESRFGE